ncbi:hypothetical protein PLICRDRAFT_179702 [Plicaturopsis crispa FD-325 SS-3]|uniref:Uncharacterized protein n=1 Tax=Plicaturopsis crispa FD-325 SS-3 TaxID=944288 RepID=A0A0C9SXL8_PLICR|nr:hypothetical protein PLICRDRAFT_179702 [Plicaturopsis crispa FD-325 SS-3]
MPCCSMQFTPSPLALAPSLSASSALHARLLRARAAHTLRTPTRAHRPRCVLARDAHTLLARPLRARTPTPSVHAHAARTPIPSTHAYTLRARTPAPRIRPRPHPPRASPALRTCPGARPSRTSPRPPCTPSAFAHPTPSVFAHPTPSASALPHALRVRARARIRPHPRPPRTFPHPPRMRASSVRTHAAHIDALHPTLVDMCGLAPAVYGLQTSTVSRTKSKKQSFSSSEPLASYADSYPLSVSVIPGLATNKHIPPVWLKCSASSGSACPLFPHLCLDAVEDGVPLDVYVSMSLVKEENSHFWAI